MDGLLALAAPPAEAAIADPAAHDPAATAVLAEVIEGANAIDQLIDTVAGGGAVREAAEASVLDLAPLLDQSGIFEAGKGPQYRQSVGEGKRGLERVGLGGGRII